MKETERVVGGEGGTECEKKMEKDELHSAMMRMDHRAQWRGSELSAGWGVANTVRRKRGRT